MLLNPAETVFARAVANLALGNPFEEEEVKKHIDAASAVDLPSEVKRRFAPLRAGLTLRAETLSAAEGMVETVRERLANGKRGDEEERILYRDMVMWVLYFRFEDQLKETVRPPKKKTTPAPAPAADGKPAQPAGTRVTYFNDFVRAVDSFMEPAGGVSTSDAAHWFAGFCQICRAFTQIDKYIEGRSKPIVRLRAAVWQSIFTHDMRRYRDILFERMHEIATLITGPSGTGKELVARAIGLSRYVEFDPVSKRFKEDFAGAFHAVNLSALAPQLIESELFGHCKGAFTSAENDRKGWLEDCHTVFLDEIGELKPAIQVKLLRVLQDRRFQRLGETEPRDFGGKVIAATNRDLAQLTSAGQFRRDFYYRLCADLIHTPSLSEQLRDDPGELPRLVKFHTRRILGADLQESDDNKTEACASVTREVVAWIEEHLGADYPWPGNIRELEQCVRNILVRKEYIPLRQAQETATEAFLRRLADIQVSVDELLDWYCKAAYERTGSYVGAAARLGLDRRTLRWRVRGE